MIDLWYCPHPVDACTCGTEPALNDNATQFAQMAERVYEILRHITPMGAPSQQEETQRVLKAVSPILCSHGQEGGCVKCSRGLL